MGDHGCVDDAVSRDLTRLCRTMYVSGVPHFVRGNCSYHPTLLNKFDRLHHFHSKDLSLHQKASSANTRSRWAWSAHRQHRWTRPNRNPTSATARTIPPLRTMLLLRSAQHPKSLVPLLRPKGPNSPTMSRRRHVPKRHPARG